MSNTNADFLETPPPEHPPTSARETIRDLRGKAPERRCSRCKSTLPEGRTHNYCTSCNRDYQEAWKKRNPGAAAKAARAWRERTGYSERHAEARRVSLRNRGAFRGVEFGSDEDAYLHSVAQDPCSYCGAPGPSELDHIEAGVDDVVNITAACRSCNARKGAMSLLGWMLRRSLLDDGFDEKRREWDRARQIAA